MADDHVCVLDATHVLHRDLDVYVREGTKPSAIAAGQGVKIDFFNKTTFFIKISIK